MNRHVNAIAGRLSLRPPQRRSLEILDRITEIAPPKKGVDLQAALDAIRSEHASVTDFEREFPSLCFALATGAGKGEPGARGTSVGEVVVRDQYQMGVRWSCITVSMGVLG